MKNATHLTLWAALFTLTACGDDGGSGSGSSDDGTSDDGGSTDGGDDGTSDDGSGDTGDTGDTGGGTTGGSATRTLSWSLSGLEPLGDGFVYEGWIIVDGAPVSTGRFTVDENGDPSATSVDVDEADATAATKFVLSIEPEPDDDPGPAATKLLGGDFDGDAATLVVSDGAALGDDLSGAAGGYILETPSTGTVADDYHQGIWWLDPAGGPGASLSLPTLPEGWAYEGWVVGDAGPVSTGRFTAADAADSDDVGPDAGPDAGPPFPGQDFIDPAMTLIGGMAVISIEPEPDDGAAPFLLKPLVDTDVEDVGAGTSQDMSNNAMATNPTGTATLE